MSQPLVSVIINTRNDVTYLREAIHSVYAQTYQHFEIIVYDNASTVDINGVLKDFDERLRYCRSEAPLTLGAARNGALAEAKGELIDFLDADDLFLPEKLARQVPLFDDERVGLVFATSEHFMVKAGVDSVVEIIEARPVSGNIFGDLIREYFISWDTAMFRRSAIGDDPDNWFNPHFNICTDYDLFLRLAHQYHIVSLPERLSRWRSHDTNLSKRLTGREPLEMLEMVPRILTYEPNLFRDYGREIRRFLARAYLGLGNFYWANGLKREAWGCSLHAFSLTFSVSALAKLVLIPLTDYETGMRFKR